MTDNNQDEQESTMSDAHDEVSDGPTELDSAEQLGSLMGALLGSLDGSDGGPISTDSMELFSSLALGHAFLDGFCSRFVEVTGRPPTWSVTSMIWSSLDEMHTLVASLEANLKQLQIKSLLMSGGIPDRTVISRDGDSLSFGTLTGEMLDAGLLRSSTGEFDDPESGAQHPFRRLRFVDIFPREHQPLEDVTTGD